jgi:hypothetical protein
MPTQEEWTALLNRVSKLEREVAALSTPTSVLPWDGRIDIEAARLVSELGGDCTPWHFARTGGKLSLKACLMVPNDKCYRILDIPISENINSRSKEAWEVVQTAIKTHFEQHSQPKP